MNSYGKAALDVVELINQKIEREPEKAWEIATIKIFGRGTAAQKKGCPKGAFLGLCEEGLVKGIPNGKYTNSEKNKGYAIRAVTLLRENPSLVHDPKALWTKVAKELRHNAQMDVVLALWMHQLIVFG